VSSLRCGPRHTTEGARIWVGHGVLAHKLIKVIILAG